ncbi:siderophore-interacting protein [Actinokineospora iranica]|uniref:NADPH-dependent ferric siderophore reductase, contains FAD-binding and SIP domains n=1 Tax=Actinokineospora iranica TaxID=1271860 RepID=A0A1G6UW78_9PSEU|nr:siderophore-interacting protein [Actinokineospora iranica]SDD45582.1 NADPH-dependent ferric siderophore reductase, contains FAD-binding and SIP domains [Actinokineospora iranica]
MSSKPEAPARRRSRRQETRLWRVPVVRVERVTPHLARVTVHDDSLADLAGAGTDQNVMLYFYPEDTVLPEPLTLESARALWSQVRPLTRTYTIRRHDPVTNEVDFDFVLHGDSGPASAWAQRVQVGDHMIFVGPSPAYQPDPAADWYLLAGDETALPAISSILAVLPPGKPVLAYVEVADAAEEQPVPGVTWLHRDGVPAGESTVLVDAIRAAELPDGTPEVWLAGERGAMLAVRTHLLSERGYPRQRVRPTTYWRLGESGN